MKSYKKFKVIFTFFIFIFTGISATKQTANDKFKNLQVLPKNISEDSLDKIMDRFSNGLGVNCDYCHVHDKTADKIEFEKDDKPEKEIARLMLRMTFDINKKYFHFNELEKTDSLLLQPVTCFTCHRGEPRPIVIHKELKKPL